MQSCRSFETSCGSFGRWGSLASSAARRPGSVSIAPQPAFAGNLAPSYPVDGMRRLQLHRNSPPVPAPRAAAKLPAHAGVAASLAEALEEPHAFLEEAFVFALQLPCPAVERGDLGNGLDNKSAEQRAPGFVSILRTSASTSAAAWVIIPPGLYFGTVLLSLFLRDVPSKLGRGCQALTPADRAE
jgi:hypothetical protein